MSGVPHCDKKSIYRLNITTQNATALAILGYAAAAIMCEKLPIARQVKIESETTQNNGVTVC